jgi:hypothetical protein
MKPIIAGVLLSLLCSSLSASPTGILYDDPDFTHSEIKGTSIECSRYDGAIVFAIAFARPEQHSDKGWRLESQFWLRKVGTQDEYDFTSSTRLADQPLNTIRFSIREDSLDRVRFEISYHDDQKHNGRKYVFDLKAISTRILNAAEPKP